MATKLTNDRDPVEVEAEPVVWVDFAANGNVRFWTADQYRAQRETEAGRAMQPLYTAAAIRALPLSDAPASPWPKDLDIGAAEAALSEVLSGYDYEMPADGMRRVIAAALRLPTPPAKDEQA